MGILEPQPIIRLGPDAHVQSMTAELSLLDPHWKAMPVTLEAGARIDQLNLFLDWHGGAADESRTPIASSGGSIGQLRWMNTPPLYVGGAIRGQHTVAITFSRAVKAAGFTAGVHIEVNGAPVGIVSGLRDAAQADTALYQINRSIGPKDTVIWRYDSGAGVIQGVDGDQLTSIAAKPVTDEMAAERTNTRRF